MPVRPRVPAAYEYIPTITQFSEAFVDIALYVRRGTAGAGAEIDEGVVGDGRAEDGLERAGNEGGGRRRLEDWGSVFPKKSENCLDEGAEGSREPRIGSMVLVFGDIGEDKMGWGFGTKTDRQFRRDEGEEWGEGAPWRLIGRIGESN